MNTPRSALTLLALTLTWACSASHVPAPSIGGETNWLMRCQDDAGCKRGSCICGVCTRDCTADRACDGAFAGTCSVTTTGAGQALCAEQTSNRPARLCLPKCSTASECGKGFECQKEVCVPARVATGTPLDAGRDATVATDGTVPASCDAAADGGCAGRTLEAQLMASRSAWDALSAAMGDTYFYAEENCLVNATTHTVTTVQVRSGVASLFTTSMIPTSQCKARVNRYADFVPSTVPQLYDDCGALLAREGRAVTLAFDDLGVIRGCTWPGAPGCSDNCGEGFYLSSLKFGQLEVP